ncbi:hypothetical protein [Agrobacterium radiobacter]|uniref:hypothetical protein n=1 Tax=Agrobacterium radiobacter TaxID=362 RepID=UPI003CE6FECB
MTGFGKGLIDELARVDHCTFKDGWASHDLHKRAGIEIGTLTREVARLRQLLSEAQKREKEARAKALEDAALFVENRNGEIPDRQEIAKAIRDMQSEDR